MGIRKRGKNWLVTVELGRDEKGIRRRDCVTCASEKEAIRKEAILAAEVARGIYFEPSTMTLGEFLKEWLAHVKGDVRQRTYDRYETAVQKHLTPVLGKVPLASLTPLHIERFKQRQAQAKLAPATITKHFWTLHKALDRAVAWGMLAANPCDRVEAPRVPKPRVRTLSVDEQAKLLLAAQSKALYGPILLALATGMRRGEVLALRWADIDFEHATLSVVESIEESTAGVGAGEAKTEHARRQVRVPETIVEFLKGHKEEQEEERRNISTYEDRGLVFPRSNGSPKRPSAVTRDFGRLCAKLEIAGVHFHCLRHTHATELLRAGVPVKVVSERLGHASITTTLATYAHVLPDMQDAAASEMGVLLAKLLRPSTR